MKKIGEFFKKLFSKENLKKFYRTFVWLMVLMFVIDITTKWAIVNHFGYANMATPGIHSESGAIAVIKGFCYIGGSLNEGMAFSFLDGKRILLLIISLVMTGLFIGYYAYSYKKLDTLTKIGLALMISGAFGNLIDRAFYWKSITGFNGVVDWIIFRFGPNEINEFAMFNIADSCLVIGIILIIIKMVIDEIKAAKEKANRGEFKYSPEELEKINKEQENNQVDEGNQGE